MNPTSIERRLMREMDARKMSYVFQHRVPGGFHVDFAFPERMVAVECDGDYWHAHPKKYSRKDLDKIQRRNVVIDRDRARAIKSSGWKIVRFWEEQIERDVAGCVNLIEETLDRSKVKMSESVFDSR